LVLAESNGLGKTYRDQRLTQDMLHRLTEAEVDSKGERGDEFCETHSVRNEAALTARRLFAYCVRHQRSGAIIMPSARWRQFVGSTAPSSSESLHSALSAKIAALRM